MFKRIVTEDERGRAIPATPVYLVRPNGDFATPGNPIRLSSLGYRRIALPDPSSGGAVALDDVPAAAVMANIIVEGAAVRYRDDHFDPTPQEGMPIGLGGTIKYDSVMDDLRFIGQTAGAVLHVTFYGLLDDA